MQKSHFDAQNRFVIPNYSAARPFASFLPGIAGPLGIPLWVFYVNRGQAITSFGVENKDNPIMEFQPANKAYRITAYTGFRTFVKIQGQVYEPFSPWQRDASTQRQMFIAMNELELQESAPRPGLQTNVLYFTLPGENLAGLVRQVGQSRRAHIRASAPGQSKKNGPDPTTANQTDRAAAFMIISC